MAKKIFVIQGDIIKKTIPCNLIQGIVRQHNFSAYFIEELKSVRCFTSIVSTSLTRV